MTCSGQEEVITKTHVFREGAQEQQQIPERLSRSCQCGFKLRRRLGGYTGKVKTYANGRGRLSRCKGEFKYLKCNSGYRGGHKPPLGSRGRGGTGRGRGRGSRYTVWGGDPDKRSMWRGDNQDIRG